MIIIINDNDNDNFNATGYYRKLRYWERRGIWEKCLSSRVGENFKVTFKINDMKFIGGA